MTFEEYKTEVNQEQARHPHWRYGQTAFNVLLLNRADLSEQIRGTGLDPFHQDSLLPKFYEWVKEHW